MSLHRCRVLLCSISSGIDRFIWGPQSALWKMKTLDAWGKKKLHLFYISLHSLTKLFILGCKREVLLTFLAGSSGLSIFFLPIIVIFFLGLSSDRNKYMANSYSQHKIMKLYQFTQGIRSQPFPMVAIYAVLPSAMIQETKTLPSTMKIITVNLWVFWSWPFCKWSCKTVQKHKLFWGLALGFWSYSLTILWYFLLEKKWQDTSEDNFKSN